MIHRSPAGSPRPPREGDDDGRSQTAESVLLTDPDGAVTRVAPWSTWTREQRRAPGGEPSLVTRLDQGQLWFSAGSSGSPWRHEVRVGPAVVSTPRGRFHAIAEDDGGATVACLAGRTRVSTAFREPVLLDADQTVAVSSDGTTMVVINRESEPGLMLTGSAKGRPGRNRSRLPEAASIVALLALLVGAVFLFGRGLVPNEQVMVPVDFVPETVIDAPSVDPATVDPTVSEADTGPAEVGDADIAEDVPPAPSTAPTTSAPLPAVPPQVAPVTAPPGTATGRLIGCRRSATGVVATVDVVHRSGGPDRFTVDVALVDRTGTVFATGSSRTPVIEPSASFALDVAVDAESAARGACELTGITSA